MRLFDACAGFGGAAPGVRGSVLVEDVAGAYERLEIGRALVRLLPDSLDTDIPRSNARLFDGCTGRAGWVPCPVAAPNSAEDLAPEDVQVEGLIRSGAGAAALRPALDEWVTADWCAGPLLRALESRRMPAFLSLRHVGLEQVAELAGRHEALPVLLADATYRQQRVLMALLGAFPNVRLVLSPPYAPHGGIEQVVGRLGPGRLLFGTGLPEAEPGAMVAYLMYAQIGEDARAMIAAGNMESLMEGIR